MKTEWDIVSDVLPGMQVVEKKKGSLRRPSGVPSSAAVAVILVVAAAGGVQTSSREVLGGISAAPIVFSRERIAPVRLQRASPANAAIDFEIGRSGEQLARSFEAFFRPATGLDENDQVSYVFG